MGASRSAQRAAVDNENPRVLAFGNGMIVGMTGHANPNNNARITAANQGAEVMILDREQNRFRLGFVDFTRNPPELTEPQDCLGCHGNPPRPIWQTMNYWDLLAGRSSAGLPIDRPGSIYALMANPAANRWADALQFTGYLDSLN